jgi:putative spermidine/putrescine transport system ATP-binding protein
MTSVHIQDLTKKFGDFTAVDNVTVDIPDGNFVCMLGPSGCGKTTLLRLIAGLEEKTAGSLLVGGQDYSNIPAHKRDFGMVFQSLALFPHLSVAQNIAYPLKIRGVGKPERRARAEELLELVKLPGLADRQIYQLSGGQRQRVAIARGLAIDPKVFLLDEPLSALDANLREHMQIELRMLQKNLGVTTIVVTHDQREAMSMADLVIVMESGKVHQMGTPIEIYRNPANSFVANFIGTSNLLPCTLTSKKNVSVNGHTISVTDQDIVKIEPGQSGILSIRPEDVVISQGTGSGGITANVEFIRDLGASVEIQARSGEHEILSMCTPKRKPNVKIGDTVAVDFHMGRTTVMAS